MNRSSPQLTVTDCEPTPNICSMANLAIPGESSDLERTANVPAVMIPGYEILELIGQGGFGSVYKARQYKLDRLVALKLITASDTSVDQFQSEAITLAQLCHPSIVSIYDYGQTPTHVYLAMELLEGEDLAFRMKRDGKLDEVRTWQYLRQVAEGLSYAVQHGVVHRDVKPSNLFLTSVSTGSNPAKTSVDIKILDFGLAMSGHRVTALVPSAEQPPLANGTPAFMAPEQHFGAKADLRSDLYALGVTAYQCLTGQLPFVGLNQHDIMIQKHRLPVPLPPSLANSWKILERMLNPDPRHRFQTYEELIERIDELLGNPSEVTEVSAGTRPGAISVWRILLIAAAFAAILSYVVISWPSDLPRPVEPPSNYIGDEISEALFDGATLEKWASAGSWWIGEDDEGTPVLKGSGFGRRTIPNSSHFRVVTGVDIANATVEVHFAVPAERNKGTRHVIRLSKTDGVQLGRQQGERGAFRPTNNAVEYPSANWLKDRRPYLEVRIERAGGIWSAWFHGHHLGSIRDDDTPKSSEILIGATGGEIAIDTVVYQRLKIRN